jgi:broad specificity phosphatase PhoE
MNASISRHCVAWLLTLPLLLTGLLLPCDGLAQNATEIQTGTSAKLQEPIVTTWIVIRHAEREGEADKLSSTGLERAQVINQLGEILRVDSIYSTDTLRARSTVDALAISRGIKLEIYSNPSGEWLNDIRRLNAGKVVLIVGHSNTVGVIAGQLANKPPFDTARDDYDSLFVITTTESPVVVSKLKPSNTVEPPQASVVRMKYGRSSVGAPAAKPEKMAPIAK